jgi:ABC-type multidrug transport system ATPase subunit
MERLAKAYGRNRVLSVESIQLDEGDRLAICGDNGSGKSTLLRILAGLVRPSGGKEYRSERWKSASVGFLPQNGGVYLDLSVRDNLRIVHCLLGNAPSSDRSSWVIERFGLKGLLEERVSSMSGGYRRLVALASLFSSGANYLFLDEPFASIDPTMRLVLEETFERFSSEFSLLVVSEHVNNIDVTVPSFWNKSVRLEALADGRNIQTRAFGIF